MYSHQNSTLIDLLIGAGALVNVHPSTSGQGGVAGPAAPDVVETPSRAPKTAMKAMSRATT